MSATLDPFVLERAPGPLVELDAALLRVRSSFRAALATLAGLNDEQLTYQWFWGTGETDIRNGCYRVAEILDSAASEAGRALAGAPPSEAVDAVAATTAARWRLHGVLVTLEDSALDADPGSGEWSIRRTMQHIINSQRGYAWGSAYWLSTRDVPRQPGRQRVPDDVFAGFPEEADEPVGDLADARRRLDDIVDATAARYATLTDDEMAVMGGWSGFPVTMGFRQWRWASHIGEHLIQIEKTIDFLGRRRSEVDWLSRHVAAAYGRLEAVSFGRTSVEAASPIYDRVGNDVSTLAQSITTAALAAVPGEEP